LINIYFYSNYSISGLGIAYSINLAINLILPLLVIYKIYKISLSKKVAFFILILCIVAVLSLFAVSFENAVIQGVSFVILFVFSLLYSYKTMTKFLGSSNLLDVFRKN
jgi:hypothetical protein